MAAAPPPPVKPAAEAKSAPPMQVAAAPQLTKPPTTSVKPAAPSIPAKPVKGAHRLAILPFKLSMDGKKYIQLVSDKTAAATRKKDVLDLVMSPYNTRNVPALDQSRVPERMADELWGGGKPDVELVRNLGRQLQVDAVMFGYFDASSGQMGLEGFDSEAIVIYLVAVESGKVFKAEERTRLSIYMGAFHPWLENALMRLVNEYRSQVLTAAR